MDDPAFEIPEPPRTAVCCGATCFDNEWSATDNLCLAEDGGVVSLEPEMGLLEIPAESYWTLGDGFDSLKKRSGPRARVSYVFFPADENPEDKPLVMFFNGGPGFSTALLFGFNTGPKTLDPSETGGAAWAPNPDSWTAFANLLYVDMPGTGYGYWLADESGTVVPRHARFDAWHDAAQFISVLLRFMKRHPQVAKNQIVLTGESYGGTRAAIMMTLALNPAELLDGGRYRNERLHRELTEHLGDVFDKDAGATFLPDEIARHFYGQVLIQPYVGRLTGGGQGCLAGGDAYQCDEPEGYLHEQHLEVVKKITSPELLKQVIGADPTSIEWLYPAARTGIYERMTEDDYYPMQDELVAAFGEPLKKDQYYLPGYDVSIPWASFGDAPGPALALTLESIYHVNTFITDAAFDTVVSTTQFPDFFHSSWDWLRADYQSLPPASKRPGSLELNFSDGFGKPPRQRSVRFPHYENAGHVVSDRAGAELSEDVQVWLNALP